MHRNTLLVLVFLAIFAALVVGVNMGRSSSQPSTPNSQLSPTPVISPTPQPLSYESDTCGIAFSYPGNFTKVEIETGGVTLANKENSNETVVAVCQKDIPRVPLPADKIETVEIGSVSAKLYHDASQKDGAPVDKLIFTHPKLKKDVYVAGFGDAFNQIIQSLHLYP